jgi:hypothetical protein
MLGLRQRLGRITWDLLMGSAVDPLCGLASGGFLWSLDRVLGLRRVHPSTLVLLPSWVCSAHCSTAVGGKKPREAPRWCSTR